MSDRVGQYLVDEGWITRDQLEKARRTRDFFGGPLDSQYMKLGFLDETTLGQALSRWMNIPYAGPAELRIIPSEVAARIPQELVEQYLLCPFEIVKKRIKVAMTNPKDAIAIAKVEAATRLTVEPWVTSNYRLNLAMERHYQVRQIQHKAVQLGPQSRTERELSHAVEGKTDPLASNATPDTDMEIGLDGRPLDAEFTLEDYDLLSAQVPPNDNPTGEDESSGKHTPEARSEGPTTSTGFDLQQASDLLSMATGRDEIADILIRFCESRCTRVGFFTASKEGYRCLASVGRAMSSEQVKKTAIPAGLDHLFDKVIEQNEEFYLGAVPPLPANRDLFSLLGGLLPPMAMILPVRIMGRIVALLYLDNDNLPITDPDVPIMRRLAAKGGMAFEILLLRNKLKQF
jgi:hypothetical protein